MASMKKSSSRTANGHRLIGLLLLLAGCLIVSAKLGASVRPAAPAKVSNRALTFADRVAYQYAIEEVYWRHRIWPKENPKPKPSLDEVMSAEQVEKKVKDYLRDSQLLEAQWQRPITPQQLQAEMDRMTSNTKQPDILRELFAALGSDPGIIAECLARPKLSERLLADLKTYGKAQSLVPSRANAARSMSMVISIPQSASYILPEISNDACTDDTWTPTN